MQRIVLLTLVGCCLIIQSLYGQGLHFSQYGNTPLLQSPANTALMPEDDFRAGVNYRNQWATIPAPFNTISAFADFQVFRNQNINNWLGLGGAFFSDRAGNGDLSLTKFQLNAAYHLQLGENSMLSGGIGAAYVQRSVNFSNLTFDVQWDGFTFNRDRMNGESNAIGKTSYADFTLGLNYAYFPHEDLYVKFGVGMLHVSQPNESLLRSGDNKLGMRPTAMLDVLVKLNSGWIANPSAYYTRQRSAHQLVFGSQFTCNVSPSEQVPSLLIMGLYHRLGESVIPVFGFEWKKIRVVSSYDVTVSSLSKANGGNGAFELSIIYQGLYSFGSVNRNAFNCPRF
jgi:type IX secretion system PorP/SprF family membrane protein